MKTYDMTCPQCGATMNLNTEDEKLCCPYCGHMILVDIEDTPDEIHAKEYAKSYGYHKGKFKAEKEFESGKKKEARSIVKIVVLVVVITLTGILSLPWLLGILAIFVVDSSRPVINPFDYVEVSFSGTDGHGELIITELVNEEVDVNEIEFEASQEYDLSVGDKVRITASSVEYKLEEDVKIFTVEGLEEYLKDLESLSQEEIETIHTYAETELEYRLRQIKEEGAVMLSYKPVKMFLITDEKYANALYDVYEFNISTASGDITYYTVASFENVIIQNTEPITIDYRWTEIPGNQNRLECGVYYYGYNTIDEARSFVTSEMESGMRLKELDLQDISNTN